MLLCLPDLNINYLSSHWFGWEPHELKQNIPEKNKYLQV